MSSSPAIRKSSIEVTRDYAVSRQVNSISINSYRQYFILLAALRSGELERVSRGNNATFAPNHCVEPLAENVKKDAARRASFQSKCLVCNTLEWLTDCELVPAFSTKKLREAEMRKFLSIRQTLWLSLLALIVLAASTPSANADSIILDQTNTALPLGTLFQNISVFSPIGQSFTPALSSVNFVNLLTETGGSTTPFTLELFIRAGSISGTILGVSQQTTATPPSPFASIVTSFTFATPVTLVPGNLYVMQVVVVSGDALVGSADTNNYAGGTQILGGIAQPNNDLWFQEGISVPEPGMLLLLGTGLLCLGPMLRRRFPATLKK